MFGFSAPHRQQINHFSSHPDNSSGKLHYLKKCKREARSEYENALAFYNQQEKEIIRLHQTILETISTLNHQKIRLEKSFQEASIEKQKANWEKINLEKILRQQQEQITLYQSQKEDKEENVNLFRRENLLQLKERQMTVQANNNSFSAQAVLTRQIKQVEQTVKRLKTSNQAKTAVVEQSDQKLQRIQEDSLKTIQQINKIEDQVERNTHTIEQHLKSQSLLANKYGQLKRNKKLLQARISQKITELQEEQNITNEFVGVEQTLCQAFSQIKVNIQSQNASINKLRSETASQRREIATNKECLSKLMQYLQNLKSQNTKIETYMERVLEEDYKIKSIIDRKHSRPKHYPREDKQKYEESKWQNSSENKSMSSTFS